MDILGDLWVTLRESMGRENRVGGRFEHVTQLSSGSV